MARVIVAVVVACCLSVAGCSFFVGQESAALPSTEETCLTDNVPRGGELDPSGNVTPEPYPATPTRANNSTISEFVVAFERAYYINSVLQDSRKEKRAVERIILGYSNATVEQHEDGHVVNFRVSGSVYYAGGTIADLEELDMEYFLNETVIVRDTGVSADAVNGTVLIRCVRAGA